MGRHKARRFKLLLNALFLFQSRFEALGFVPLSVSFEDTCVWDFVKAVWVSDFRLGCNHAKFRAGGDSGRGLCNQHNRTHWVTLSRVVRFVCARADQWTMQLAAAVWCTSQKAAGSRGFSWWKWCCWHCYPGNDIKLRGTKLVLEAQLCPSEWNVRLGYCSL